MLDFGSRSRRGTTIHFYNLSLFAQDTWHASPRATVTYGVRWDVDFAPSSTDGPNFPAVTGYNLNDLSALALAPSGRPPFATPYGNVAPRLGVAYRLFDDPKYPAWCEEGSASSSISPARRLAM